MHILTATQGVNTKSKFFWTSRTWTTIGIWELANKVTTAFKEIN